MTKTLALSEIQAGDIWADDERVSIVSVAPAHRDYVTGLDMVRFSGIITKGYGASKKVRTWCFPADMKILVERA